MSKTVRSVKDLLLIRVILVLILGSILGTVLLIGVFSLPTESIYNHVKDSTYIFDIEGTYPLINENSSKMLDNYTDALMLSEAAYNKEDVGIVEKAMAVYSPAIQGYTPDQTLSIYMKNGSEYTAGDYTRYWHGFLVVLKPMLLYCNYLGIRGINRVVQVCMAILVVFCLYKKKMKHAIVPFLVSYLFLRPDALGLSLQYSSIYYIVTMAILSIVLCREKIERKCLYPIVFLIIGMCTSYFDFLTYPLVTLGLPLTVVMMYQNREKVSENVKKIVGYSGMWGIGYIGMWSGKWLVGSILLKKNLFVDAINQIKFRTSTHAAKVEFSYMDVIGNNVWAGFLGIEVIALIVIVVLLGAVIFKNRKDLKKVLLSSIPFMVIMIMPFCWYILAANHSYIHTGFTYRELVIAVFAFLCMGFRALSNNIELI